MQYKDILREIGNGPLSISALARKLNMNYSVLTGYLMRLEEERTIKKIKVGRSYVYQLTGIENKP